MKSLMKGYGAMAIMMAAVAASVESPQGLPRCDKRRKDYEDEVAADRQQPKPKVVPKGCKEYHFFDPDFYCVASSEKRANEKYEKFKQSQDGH